MVRPPFMPMCCHKLENRFYATIFLIPTDLAGTASADKSSSGFFSRPASVAGVIAAVVVVIVAIGVLLYMRIRQKRSVKRRKRKEIGFPGHEREIAFHYSSVKLVERDRGKTKAEV